MRTTTAFLSLLLLGNAAWGATITVGQWTPIFVGVELATCQQQAQTSSEPDHQVRCLRVDLTAPGVSLLTTPGCTNCGSYETLAENTSHFLEANGVQVAVNGGFYGGSGGSTDASLGSREEIYGLAISRGEIVSPADDSRYLATMLFTSNNVPIFIPHNSPATNTSGIYTAISGNLALLIGGVNQRAATPRDLDPRTALGLSADRRYLLLLTIDGRQPGWSDGADFHDTGEWLKRFGASDGINVDGGGSTTMARSDCTGRAVRLNRSSYAAAYGRERNIAQNLGVYAQPLPSELKDFTLEPASTTASFTWLTDLPATTQVEYGATTNYGSVTPVDGRLVRQHVATLAGLTPGSTYCFRASSTTATGQTLTEACEFTTVLSQNTIEVFGLTNIWTYTTNNLDGVAWMLPGYEEADWLGQGPGLLCVEDAAYVQPKNTALPPDYGQRIPTTYYFRTHFAFPGSAAGASLTFSNYVDDGAVFYLNGAEVYRLRLPEAPEEILGSTLAIGYACVGTATAGDAAAGCPDVFTVSGEAAANLRPGDNVLAVEVHNYNVGSLDVVFGSALSINTPTVGQPRLHLWMEEGIATLFWNGEGFTLQQAADLSRPENWRDVPGAASRSPVTVAPTGTMYYRLR